MSQSMGPLCLTFRHSLCFSSFCCNMNWRKQQNMPSIRLLVMHTYPGRFFSHEMTLQRVVALRRRIVNHWAIALKHSTHVFIWFSLSSCKWQIRFEDCENIHCTLMLFARFRIIMYTYVVWRRVCFGFLVFSRMSCRDALTSQLCVVAS